MAFRQPRLFCSQMAFSRNRLRNQMLALHCQMVLLDKHHPVANTHHLAARNIIRLPKISCERNHAMAAAQKHRLAAEEPCEACRNPNVKLKPGGYPLTTCLRSSDIVRNGQNGKYSINPNHLITHKDKRYFILFSSND